MLSLLTILILLVVCILLAIGLCCYREACYDSPTENAISDGSLLHHIAKEAFFLQWQLLEHPFHGMIRSESVKGSV
jgi:hypothetical protein